MLYLPPGTPTTDIVGVDPGSTTLGLSVITIEPRTLKIVGIKCRTLDASRLTGYDHYGAMVGDRLRRIKLLSTQLFRILIMTKPYAIVTETPYFNPRTPGAFQALVEVIAMLRNVVWDADPWLALNVVEPSNLILAVGATANSQFKGDIKAAIKSISEITDVMSVDELDALDEHSIDSLAAAYYFLVSERKRGAKR